MGLEKISSFIKNQTRSIHTFITSLIITNSVAIYFIQMNELTRFNQSRLSDESSTQKAKALQLLKQMWVCRKERIADVHCRQVAGNHAPGNSGKHVKPAWHGFCFLTTDDEQ
jgi:hypothetical protein